MVIYECVTGWIPFQVKDFFKQGLYKDYVSKKKKEDIRDYYDDKGMNVMVFKLNNQ